MDDPHVVAFGKDLKTDKKLTSSGRMGGVGGVISIILFIQRIIIIMLLYMYDTRKMTTKINQLTQNNSSRKDGCSY